MIFYAIFAVLITIFSSLISVVVPVLPDFVSSVFTTITQYLSSAVRFCWVFIPKTYVISLFQWWVTFSALLLTYELTIHILRLITGNIGGKKAKENN